jgi:hypothetical protein
MFSSFAISAQPRPEERSASRAASSSVLQEFLELMLHTCLSYAFCRLNTPGLPAACGTGIVRCHPAQATSAQGRRMQHHSQFHGIVRCHPAAYFNKRAETFVPQHSGATAAVGSRRRVYHICCAVVDDAITATVTNPQHSSIKSMERMFI